MSSRDVADTFAKEHRNVLAAIDALECSNDFKSLNFQPLETTQKNVFGLARPMREYLMTRDGLTFLAMGFTGSRAAEFKELYIQAFNAMEAKLAALAAPAPEPLEMLRLMFQAVDAQRCKLQVIQTQLTEQATSVACAIDEAQSALAEASEQALSAPQVEELLLAMKYRARVLSSRGAVIKRASSNPVANLMGAMQSCIKHYFFDRGTLSFRTWKEISRKDFAQALSIIETWDVGQNRAWASANGMAYRRSKAANTAV